MNRSETISPTFEFAGRQVGFSINIDKKAKQELNLQITIARRQIVAEGGNRHDEGEIVNHLSENGAGVRVLLEEQLITLVKEARGRLPHDVFDRRLRAAQGIGKEREIHKQHKDKGIVVFRANTASSKNRKFA